MDLFAAQAFPREQRAAIASLEGALRRPSVIHRAKAQVALVVPPSFSAADARHRRELGIALGLLGQLAPGHEPRFLSGSAQLAELVGPVEPFTPEGLEGCAFAFCILDRALADRCGAYLPTRLVGTDPISFRTEKWRLAFIDPLAPWLQTLPPLAPPPGGEALSLGLLFVDHLFPAEALRTAALRALEVCERVGVVVGPGVEAASLRHLPGGRLTRHEVAELEALAAEAEVLLSTDASLLAASDHRRRVLIDAAGELRDFSAAAMAPEPHDLLLYKGEDLNPLRVVDLAVLGGSRRRDSLGSRRFHRPLISVVVPVYDRTEEILRLAHSLGEQSYGQLEVLFVTNGSGPETLEAVERSLALLIRKRIQARRLSFDRAFGSATIPRDVGAYAARGTFVCFIDSDDYLEPGFFQHFEAGPVDDDCLFVSLKVFRNLGRRMEDGFPFDVPVGTGEIPRDLYGHLLKMGNIFNNSGVIAPKRLFERVRGIHHGLGYAEDYYLWLALAKAGARAVRHEGRVSITLHPGNNELKVGDPRWVQGAKDAVERGIAL